MDTRWRVPDRRYRSGYRWTPRGKRAIRKWALLIALWFVIVLGFQSGVADLLYTLALIAYGGYRIARSVREGREQQLPPRPAQPPMQPPMQPFPLAGEVRQRVQPSREVRQQVWNRDGGRCRWCGITDAQAMARDGEHLHYDHIIPFSRNGADTAQNMQLLCGPCNHAKSNRMS